MSSRLSIGIIGLDSSRSVAFAELLNNHRGRARPRRAHITMASPGPVSRSAHDAERALAHARQLQGHGVVLTERPEEVAENCDLLLLLSADARDRVLCFNKVVAYAKPMYLEKSLADTARAGSRMVGRAQRVGCRLFSASSVRFSAGWRRIKPTLSAGDPLLGIDLIGPMPPHETLPPPLWYGVHLADLAVDALGVGWSATDRLDLGCGSVMAARWGDGRFAMLWGYHDRSARYMATARRLNELVHEDLDYQPQACNAALLEEIIRVLTADEQDGAEHARMIEVVRLTESMVDLCPPSMGSAS